MYLLKFLILLILYNLCIPSKAECPPGAIQGIEGSNKCYKFYFEADIFANAEDRCVSIGGHLASISDVFTNNLIAQAFRESIAGIEDLGNILGLGGNRLNGTWTWTDGTKFGYTNFASGEPGDAQCLTIQAENGQWYGTPCTQTWWYICEIPGLQPKSCRCDPDWTFHNGSCYKVFHNLNWTDAENFCLSNGAHLTSIHSNDENDFVVNLAKTGLTLLKAQWQQQVWIGLNSIAQQEVFVWSDGTPYDFRNWCSICPNGPVTDRCALIFADLEDEIATYDNGKWADYDCSEQFRAFVCKKAAK